MPCNALMGNGDQGDAACNFYDLGNDGHNDDACNVYALGNSKAGRGNNSLSYNRSWDSNTNREQFYNNKTPHSSSLNRMMPLGRAQGFPGNGCARRPNPAGTGSPHHSAQHLW